ncbi:hypothetical protein HHI36_018726 [Cryptolaemus montrouzieri]|uniref:Cathepsin propeptide inhibitor domain-containing protein n=1 Tax=Cryptolaemus montrouzieri TaxID=559131 RepID=A0ABD2P0W9_9CUCU
MKSCALLLLFVVIVALCEAAPIENLDSKWEDFKKTQQRSYESPEEETRRKEIFRKNLEGIEEHNQKFARGEVTYQQGVNQFTDLTKEEFSKRLGFKPNGSSVGVSLH